MQRRAGPRGEGAQPRAVLRDQLLVGGDDVLAVRDRAEHEFASQPHPADALDDDAHLRVVDDRERVGVPVRPRDVAPLPASRTATARSNPGCAASRRRATAVPTTPQPSKPTPKPAARPAGGRSRGTVSERADIGKPPWKTKRPPPIGEGRVIECRGSRLDQHRPTLTLAEGNGHNRRGRHHTERGHGPIVPHPPWLGASALGERLAALAVGGSESARPR